MASLERAQPDRNNNSLHSQEQTPPKDQLALTQIFANHFERFRLETPPQLQDFLFQKLEELELPTGDGAAINTALDIMHTAHQGQKRKYSGQPYTVHTLRVALMAIDIAETMNKPVTQELVIAALLHDTVEDSDMTERKLFSRFYRHGDIFASKVSGNVEAVSHTDEEKGRMPTDEYFNKIKTHREPYEDELMERFIIKTADRTDNLLDPPLSPAKVTRLPDLPEKLKTSRNNLIDLRTRREFIPYLLDQQPLLQNIVKLGADLSAQTLTKPDFSLENWEEYLTEAA